MAASRTQAIFVICSQDCRICCRRSIRWHDLVSINTPLDEKQEHHEGVHEVGSPYALAHHPRYRPKSRHDLEWYLLRAHRFRDRMGCDSGMAILLQ